ncbi:hypothetical protein ACJJTC_012954, partial [Scirpophaga incertulas]
SDRANSLPGSHRRPSLESVKSRKPESPRRQATSSSRSHETSLEDDVSLDLSQVSDFEDTNSKYGAKQKSRGVAIATPKDPRSKTRNCSLHQQMESSRSQKSLDFSQETYTCSRNSVYTSSAGGNYSNWGQWGSGGEWSSFWARYSRGQGHGGDPRGLDVSTDGSVKLSPDNLDLNCILKNEGLHLTPKETQNMIKCAHILGNVLSSAIDRRYKDKDDSRVSEVTQRENVEAEKKNLTLDLRETNLPAEVEEERRQETVTTQTDISLPNTRSAPRIFEKILRQLSKSSLDEAKSIDVKDTKDEVK